MLDHALGDRKDDGRGVVLAGHSLGVQTSLEAYRRLGDRVRAFVLPVRLVGDPAAHVPGGRDNLERLLPAVNGFIGLMPQVVRGVWRNVLNTELSYQVATRMRAQR